MGEHMENGKGMYSLLRDLVGMCLITLDCLLVTLSTEATK